VRISERKRQLREQAGSPNALAERAEARVRTSQQKASSAREPSPRTSSGARQRQAPVSARARKQRGARFYAGFGIVGLFFSILLLSTTVTSYNSEKDKYPAKVRQYQAAQLAYPMILAQYNSAKAAVATYQAAVKKHVKPLPKAPANMAPKAPAKPAAPVKPELNVISFALPILYGLLSIAYLYLAYRARKPDTPLFRRRNVVQASP
jgi:hypothetical protein